MNKNNIITCLLTLLALLCPMQGKASYMFKHYGVQNGLSQSTVYTIMQDRTGFIWIGTKEGLNRFDGTSFKIYRAYNDEHSLQSDFITSLYEDADGNIWVGTDIGVWIYNPMTDSFHHFNTKTAGGTIITNSVNVITGNNRYIYISANEQGVFRYDIKERTLTNNPLPGYSNVVGMSLGKDNRIWLGLFGDGLYSADLSLRNVQPFTAADGSQPFANDIVSSILPYSADRLYIGADRHGLCEVNTSTRQCNIIADRYDGKNIFVRMVAQKQNEIWAASEMDCIYIMWRHVPCNTLCTTLPTPSRCPTIRSTACFRTVMVACGLAPTSVASTICLTPTLCLNALCRKATCTADVCERWCKTATGLYGLAPRMPD